MSSVTASMGTAREDISDAVSSGKLPQKPDSDTRFDELESNIKTSHLPVSSENIKSEISQHNEKESYFEEIPNDTTNQHDINQKENRVPKIEPSDLLSKVSKEEPDKFQLRPNPNTGVMGDGEKTISLKKEMASDIFVPVQLCKGGSISQSAQKKLTGSTRPEKALEKLQPKEEPNTNLQPRQCSDAENLALLSKGDKCAIKRHTVSENLRSSIVEVPILQSDEPNFSYSRNSEKVEKLQPRRNPDPGVQVSHSDAENTPFRVVEKGLDDDYNWRKYGQKIVKGNEFIRSYYKCTYPYCLAKKQVERSHDGHKTDVNYIGNHEHPKPQHTPQASPGFQVRTPEISSVTSSKTDGDPIIAHGDGYQHIEQTETPRQSVIARNGDGVAGAVSSSNGDNNDKNDYPDSKRQKRETASADDNLLNKPNSDLRHVVQTLSAVDMVNDGYRWRKYGQKLVKGNPNPRSYYRCSNPGCPVKKHVERDSRDAKVVITTYEGQHVHDMPPSRTVSQNTAGDDANKTTTNGESKSIPGENNPVEVEISAN
ncbi:hypothetical protein RD792_000259 [Penstemon davidsonii]|uniref:WRKY domain-containing protein n=1 Tax=Penstemon davidsonii TaxID=160366 RepID=A0ABR0DUQ2_9LAMI|nr:hypothetical protein RD792_000259 [Penstemon davidsonii]